MTALLHLWDLQHLAEPGKPEDNYFTQHPYLFPLQHWDHARLSFIIGASVPKNPSVGGHHTSGPPINFVDYKTKIKDRT